MNKIIFFISIFLLSLTSNGQALPANRYYNLSYLLDETTQSPSFAYSLRKLKSTYTGFAVRVRRSSDNAEANVDFDANDVVSATSNVTVTAVGTSGLTIGQVLNYNTFRGVATLFVTTWYDQGLNAYHATQTNNLLQPTLVLNSASPSNSLPSILYDGTVPPDYLSVGQPIQNIIANGINGSFLLVMKPTTNAISSAFGMVNGSTNWRWSFHVNWSDGNLYFDAAEVCCGAGRAFNNNANLNFYKQYSFIRGTTTKVSRVNNAFRVNVTGVPSTTQTGGGFYLGASLASGNRGFYGNTSEIIMFPTDLSTAVVSPIELNQMMYWGL